MSRQIQIRRGTSAQHNNFTGAIGEVTMDTTNKTLRVHDGATRGGNEIMSVDKFFTNISNCIYKIPMDICLALSNNSLVLKSGSKIYKPNGTGVFDEVIIENDKTWTTGSSGTYFVFISGTSIDIVKPENCYSGSSAPTGVTQYSVWYDTTNNIIKKTNDSGSTWQGIYTFPVCKITTDGTGVKSIDQIFNGFGYIGSTVFVLPGLSGLIPNGRNSDGTLKNIKLNVTNLMIQTFTGTANTTLFLKTNAIGEGNSVWYDSVNNYNYYSSGSTSPESFLSVATMSMTSGKISNWDPRSVFVVPERAEIANLAMPSKQYTELTLGTDGSSYIAPADGYFTINKGGSNGEWLYLLNNNTGLNISCLYPAGLNARAFMPVAKGDSVRINYTASGTTNYFRFVYANGSK